MLTREENHEPTSTTAIVLNFLFLTDEDIRPLWDAISNNPNAAQAIVKLELGGNQLTSVSSEGLGALQRLYLNGNQLTSVCKIMLEAKRYTLLGLNYGDPINQQVLTNEMLAEHSNTVLNAAQRELSNTRSWLSMVRRIRRLPDELCRMVFECVYGLDHIPQEMNRIKRALPGQMQNIQDFEESDVFAKIKKQYNKDINSLCNDSFNDAKNMKALLSSYRQSRDTPDFRYLQDDTRYLGCGMLCLIPLAGLLFGKKGVIEGLAYGIAKSKETLKYFDVFILVIGFAGIAKLVTECLYFAYKSLVECTKDSCAADVATTPIVTLFISVKNNAYKLCSRPANVDKHTKNDGKEVKPNVSSTQRRIGLI